MTGKADRCQLYVSFICHRQWSYLCYSGRCTVHFRHGFKCSLTHGAEIQSNPVFWTRLVIFEALPWPNRWFNQQRVVIWLWVDALGYNISKNQLPRSKTVASSHKKVHFWNPIWRTPSALWNGPSPISLSFLIWSRWDLVCQSTLGSSWLVPNLIKFSKELAEI